MKLTIIYDNEVHTEGLKADWGVSFLIESEDTRMLFDTGAKGDILLWNMQKLGITAGDIDEIFISHDHWDHAGGIPALLKTNPDIRIYVPESYKSEGKNLIRIKEPTKIREHMYSTGELAGIEQSLLIETKKGLIIVSGCAHPGIDKILETASTYGKIHALIGGLHGFNEFCLLDDIELVCPCHCTQHIKEIETLYPDKYIQGGAGKVINL